MSAIYTYLNDLIGTIPDGFEPVAWLVSAIIFIFILSSVYRIVISLFGWMK